MSTLLSKKFSSPNLRNYPDEVKKCYILTTDLSDIVQIETVDNLKVKIKALNVAVDWNYGRN